MYHGPNWQPIPTLCQDVEALVQRPAWVVDSHGYSQVREISCGRPPTRWFGSTIRVPCVATSAPTLRAVAPGPGNRSSTATPNASSTGSTPSTRSPGPCRSTEADAMTCRLGLPIPQFRPLRRVRLSNPAAADLWLGGTAATGSRRSNYWLPLALWIATPSVPGFPGRDCPTTDEGARLSRRTPRALRKGLARRPSWAVHVSEPSLSTGS